MIKNFFQNNRTALLAIVITVVATSAVAYGFFVIKNERKSANQRVEALQKSVEELQAKNETNQEISEEPEKDIPVEETSVQQSPIVKKSAVVAPIKTEEAEEKLVSCVAFNGDTLKVSKDECDEIKQKNVIAQKALDKYEECISSAEEEFQENLKSGYSSSYPEEYNRSVNECAEERNAKLEKLL